MMDRHDHLVSTGTVWSYTRYGQELLHIRLLVSAIDEWNPNMYTHVLHVADARWRSSLRLKGDPEWYHWTDYGGRVVPMSVFEEMWRVEGVSKEEWEMRGVEVGEATWSVLTRWVEEQPEVDLGEEGFGGDTSEESDEM